MGNFREGEQLRAEEVIKASAIQTFRNLGYEVLPPMLKVNGLSPKVDDNFREQLIKLNSTALAGKPLSDAEFNRVQIKYPRNKSEAFGILRNGLSILRDDNSRIHLNLLNKHTPDDNVFQIAEEVEVRGLKVDRLDLVVFVNGIPIANIELKREDNSKSANSSLVQQAINQINRYQRHAIYNQGLLKFIQLYVASTGRDTRYFSADPRVDRGYFYGEQVFPWMDEKNNPVNKLEIFIEQFFPKTQLIKAIYDYMLLLPHEQGERMVIMRPNQIHATDAVVSSLARGMDTFVSASTGSGKTLTSFKLSQILAGQGKKVIMLLDRNDLAEQTVGEFLKFDTSNLVKELQKSSALTKGMVDDHQRLVVTTIQSFAKWLKRNPKDVQRLAGDKNVVLVIDECHRTTSGTLLSDIKRGFFDKTRGSLQCNLVGFTGTPLLEENAPSKELQTSVIFGESSHIYTITEAIRDKTVLPFKTFEITVDSTNSDTEGFIASKEYYSSKDRIMAISKEISVQIKSHTKQLSASKNDETKGFSAMLAASGKKDAMAYWRAITPLLSEQNRRTSIVFSIDPNGNKEYDDETNYLEIFNAWDKEWGTSYSNVAKTDFELARKTHLNDVIKQTKLGKLDLLIVSNMLLTGFDAPSVNTIYLDKNLEYHNLLQACSRTNRLNGSDKQFGNIVLFSDRDMEEKLNESIRLFGSADNIEQVIDSTDYREMLETLRKEVFTLKSLVNTPYDLENVTRRADLLRITQAFNSIVGTISRIRVFPEWDEDKGYAEVGTQRSDLDNYVISIEQARDRIIDEDPAGSEEEASEDELLFAVTTVNGEIIDMRYIMQLLNNFIASPPSERDRWLRKARNIINGSRLAEVIESHEALVNLLQACENDEIRSVDELFDRLYEEKKNIRTRTIESHAKDMGIETWFLEELLEYRNDNGKSMSVMKIKAKISNYSAVLGEPRSSSECIAIAKKLQEKIGELELL